MDYYCNNTLLLLTDRSILVTTEVINSIRNRISFEEAYFYSILTHVVGLIGEIDHLKCNFWLVLTKLQSFCSFVLFFYCTFNA